MKGQSRRNRLSKPNWKAGNKNPKQTVHRLRARIERDQCKLNQLEKQQNTPGTLQAGRTRAETETASTPDIEAADQRVLVKVQYQLLGEPGEDEWSGRDGTIAQIRGKLGQAAPSVYSVRNTVQRLARGDTEVAPRAQRLGVGRKLTAEDDKAAAELARSGYSLRLSTNEINFQRASCGQGPVTRERVREAEQRREINLCRTRHARRRSKCAARSAGLLLERGLCGVMSVECVVSGCCAVCCCVAPQFLAQPTACRCNGE
jgi:GNAT superfamily N-acetyltransferase